MSNSSPLKVLIVDDEPAARQNLRRVLGEIGGAEVVGECSDGQAAVRRILVGGIDLVLLDVQMPELDGFGVIHEVGVNSMPPVIFVTAYDEHALAAFEVYALGYLLKPVQPARLKELILRVKGTVLDSTGTTTSTQSDLLRRLVKELRPEWRATQLAIRHGPRTFFIATRDIDRIEAAGIMIRIHTKARTVETRDTLANIETVLSPRDFLRVHRSVIVRIDKIVEIQPWFKGDYVLIFSDGTQVTTGRTYRSSVQRLLRHR